MDRNRNTNKETCEPNSKNFYSQNDFRTTSFLVRRCNVGMRKGYFTNFNFKVYHFCKFLLYKK